MRLASGGFNKVTDMGVGVGVGVGVGSGGEDALIMRTFCGDTVSLIF